jgi:hypothetical protein
MRFYAIYRPDQGEVESSNMIYPAAAQENQVVWLEIVPKELKSLLL